jgi:hypothetical protein
MIFKGYGDRRERQKKVKRVMFFGASVSKEQ